MRIAFYAPRASIIRAGKSTTGDRVFVSSLVAGLKESGHEVQIASPLNVRDFWRDEIAARHLITTGIAVRRQMRRFAPDVWLVYGAALKNPDLFGWWQHPKRYVSINTDVGRPEDVPRPWRSLFTFAHRRSLQRADVIAAWRPKGVKHLRRFGLPESRISVLPHGISFWREVPGREAARARLRLPLTAPIMLCVSRLTAPRADAKPWKTEWVLEMLDALSGVPLPPDTILLVVGGGPGRARVEKRASELNLTRLVRLVDAVDHETVAAYYAACDFCVYPGYTDRPFLTLMEAQCCGRPVVSPCTDSARLIVQHGITGLLAGDVNEFREHIAALASDPARCEGMGRAAREYIWKHHSMETRVRQIEAMLDGAH